jgi:hypothetical protein
VVRRYSSISFFIFELSSNIKNPHEVVVNAIRITAITERVIVVLHP